MYPRFAFQYDSVDFIDTILASIIYSLAQRATKPQSGMVENALEPFEVVIKEHPVSPERICQLIDEARAYRPASGT